MKKILALTLSMFCLSAYSKTSRVAENYNLLGQDFKARVQAGVMNLVDIVKVPGMAPRISRTTSTKPNIGQLLQPLVIESSCEADLFYEGSGYAYETVCADSDGCDCEESETVEYKAVNLAVDVYFDTDRAYELSDIAIELVAIDRITGETILVASEFYAHKSDTFAVGDNTVVFNIDAYYLEEYVLQADVKIGDGAGSACSIRTNSL